MNLFCIPLQHRGLAGGTIPAGKATALSKFYLSDNSGAITTVQGSDYAVAGTLSVPDFLLAFEPLVIVPQDATQHSDLVNVLIVITQRPDLVSPVAAAVRSVLAVEDPTRVTIQTSETLAQLRAIIEGQPGSFSRGLVLIMLSLTGLLTAAILYGLVMVRREDFGRRRALGASRGLIITLLLTRTTALTITTALIAALIPAIAAANPSKNSACRKCKPSGV